MQSHPSTASRRFDSLLPPEGAALSQAGLASGRLAEDSGAGAADDDGLSVGEDGGDVEAAGALDVHEEGVGCRYEALLVMLDPISISLTRKKLP